MRAEEVVGLDIHLQRLSKYALPNLRTFGDLGDHSGLRSRRRPDTILVDTEAP